MTPETVTAVALLAASASVLSAAVSVRCLARAHALVQTRHPADAIPEPHDASIRIRFLRSLAAIGTTLEAMRANFEHGTAVFGNVEPPVTELGELCASAAPLGRSLDVGILHATMYWLREHGYQHAFANPSPELHECRARVDAALWETRRLMGLADDAPLPRTLADVEILAALAAPAPAVASIARERGRRAAARRETTRTTTHPAPRTANAH